MTPKRSARMISQIGADAGPIDNDRNSGFGEHLCGTDTCALQDRRRMQRAGCNNDPRALVQFKSSLAAPRYTNGASTVKDEVLNRRCGEDLQVAAPTHR